MSYCTTCRGKICVYFRTPVNAENSLSQIIICLSLYADSMVFWLLISLVYRLCELKCLLDPFLHIVQVSETQGGGGGRWRNMTTVGNNAQFKGLEGKFQSNFATALTVLVAYSIVKGNQT